MMNASAAKPTTHFQALISGEASPAVYKILLALIAVVVGGLAGIASQQLGSPLYIIVGLIGLIATIVTIQHKQWGLLVMIFLAYTRFSDVLVHEHGLPSIAQPFMLLLLGLVPGSMHLGEWMIEDHLTEFTAERRETTGWKPRKGMKRNESIDISVYGLAVAIFKGMERINWDRPPDWAVGGASNVNAVLLASINDGQEPKRKAAKKQPVRIKFLE